MMRGRSAFRFSGNGHLFIHETFKAKIVSRPSQGF